MMHDDGRDPLVERVRSTYNVPTGVPKAEMWAAIESRLETPGDAQVLELDDARRRRWVSGSSAARSGRPMAWAVAAAAVLILGIGVGRMTAPPGPEPRVAGAAPVQASDAALSLAAREHLGRTESLLTMVRADARTGRLDPATAEWAGALLSQTRLLLDAGVGKDPAVEELLLDLELLLIQIVGLTETGSVDEARARTEMELTMRTLDEGEVLPRIQAVLPIGMEGV
jgi:hypothetical protein